jgi:hypothetical protein
VCVFITAGPSTKLFTWGGGGYGRTCATRDDEPRPVWTRLPITHGSGIFFTQKKNLNRYERRLRELREEGGTGIFFRQHMETESGRSIDALCQAARCVTAVPATTAIPFTGLFIDASCKFTV